MRTIYVAGPMSAPTGNGRLRNSEHGMDVGYALMQLGWAPHIPHVMELFTRYIEGEGYNNLIGNYEFWMALDFEWIRRCDAFFYMSTSPGADRELELAKSLGKVIYYYLSDVPDMMGGMDYGLSNVQSEAGV